MENQEQGVFTVKGMVALMRDKEKGLKLKTRHHFFKSFKKCFVGSDCVDWLMENIHEPSREQAVALGQMLMRRSIIRHVTNTHPFVDGNHFYRFVMVRFSPSLLCVTHSNAHRMTANTSPIWTAT